MIIEMQLKKPTRLQSIVTCNLKQVVEILNEFKEHTEWTEDEIKAAEGDDIMQSFMRNNKALAEGLEDIVCYLELIIDVSERQDKARTIIFD